jgi:hypothetical protein
MYAFVILKISITFAKLLPDSPLLIETREFYGCFNLAIKCSLRDKTKVMKLLEKVDDPGLLEKIEFV